MDTILECTEKTETESEPTVEVSTEKTAPTTKAAKCRYCGCKQGVGGEWHDENYCSGKCKTLDGGEVAPVEEHAKTSSPKASSEVVKCRNCGCKRSESGEWYDDEYCSGKCKILDGGIIEPASLPVDTSPEVGQKHKELGELGNLLVVKRKEAADLNARLEELMDEKGDLLAKGLDTEANCLEYNTVDTKRKVLEGDIILIEEKTVPRKHQELEALKQVETSAAKEELMGAKSEIVAVIHDCFYDINSNVKHWDALQKEARVTLNQKQKSLFGEVVIFDNTRKQLKHRIAGRRIAKLATYPDDEPTE